MIKTKILKLSDVSEEKQNAIRIDIKKYLKGELRMIDINGKYDVTSFITQKLLRKEIGFDTKHNQLQYASTK